MQLISALWRCSDMDNDPYLNNAKVQKLAAYISNLFLALLLKIPLNSGR